MHTLFVVLLIKVPGLYQKHHSVISVSEITGTNNYFAIDQCGTILLMLMIHWNCPHPCPASDHNGKSAFVGEPSCFSSCSK